MFPPELNVLEMRPPRMDDSGRTKYPVLFRVYGGPGSQMVDVRYGQDWHAYVVSELQYIVVVVDGRGTGFRGRALRNPVKNNLGRWETVDQVNAAKIWATKTYVDPKRIGIWGWVRALGLGVVGERLTVFVVVWRLHELEGHRG